MYKSQSVMTGFVLQGHIWLFDKCSAEVMYLSSCDTDLNCLNILVWFRNRFYFSHTAHSSELWGVFYSHYQQTQYDRSEPKSCNSAGCLQTHLFLCAPDPILMIRRSKALLLGLWRCCSVPSSAGLRQLSAAVSLSRGFTFRGPTQSSTVLLVGLSEWGFWPAVSQRPRPGPEQRSTGHGSHTWQVRLTTCHQPKQKPLCTDGYWELFHPLHSLHS